MFEKDWTDSIEDNAKKEITALRLKSWAEQARGICATLSVFNLINDRERLLLYVTDILKSTSYMAFLLEDAINDELREIKEAK